MDAGNLFAAGCLSGQYRMPRIGSFWYFQNVQDINVFGKPTHDATRQSPNLRGCCLTA